MVKRVDIVLGLESIEERDDLHYRKSGLDHAHIAERSFSITIATYAWFTVNFAENLDTVPQNLREARPTIVFAVPRIWEKLHSGIVLGMREADWTKGAAFPAGAAIGRAHAAAVLERRRGPPRLGGAPG